MTPHRWERLKELFAEAAEAGDTDRSLLLADLRRDDPDLAEELAGLLAADHGETAADSEPDWRLELRRPAAPRPVDRIDRYVILGELGRGGMGRVFLAERADGAYRQRVALKILPSGRLASDEARRRFVAERQILARLDHPGIARLIDGGATAEGEPFLVTEFVDGRPIDEACREDGLSVQAIVRRLLGVCEAVEAAHRSLVVHRDLKPSNILVTADGKSRLLDFGIAKLLGRDGGEVVFETRLGHTPLTPRYAAPEQVRGEPVTVATDVYALGVILFELLTGASPYGGATASAAALARAICDAEPHPPSSVVGAGEPGVAGRPAARRGRIPPDLDAIVLKALAKAPERRYGSAEQLAADLRRFLDGLPVVARRATRTYRASRWLSRHRLAVALGVLAAASLVLFLVQRERQLASTQRERDKVEAALGLLVEVFGQADPAQAQGEPVTVEQALDRGAELARARLGDQPLAEATLLVTLGSVYSSLGLYERAAPPLGRALELRRRHLPRGHPEIARCERLLGDLARRRGDYAAARRDLESAIAALRERPDAASDLAAALQDLAQLESEAGDPGRAERLAHETLNLRRRDGSPDEAAVAATLDLLGSLAYLRGDNAVADEHLRRALAIRQQTLGTSHPATLESLNDLATVLFARGQEAESTRLLLEVVELRRKVLGPDHPQVAEALANLGSNYSAAGRHAEAEPMLREAVRIAAGRLGPGNVDHAAYLSNLGQAVQGLGRFAEAADLFRQALAISEAVHGRQHANTALALHNLALCRERQGALHEAEGLYREALSIYERTLPADHVFPSFTRIQLGLLALARAEGDVAAPLLEAALASRRANFGADHWRSIAVEVALGRARALAGGGAEAAAATEDAWRRLAAAPGADATVVREAAQSVAGTWERLGWAAPAAAWRRRAQTLSPD